MKLIEVEKVKRVMKDYWKAQVNKLPKPGNVRDHDDFVDRLNSYIEHNHELLKAVDELPSVEPEAISKWKKEFREYVDSLDITRDDWRGIIEYIDELPSAEPDTTTHDSIPVETGKNDEDRTTNDLISRQAVTKFLNDWLSCLFENCHKQSASDLKMIIKDFKNLPSAQPEQHLDEWCVDCKEYDKEKHSCPRWNRVIRQTLLDAQPERKTGHWILDRSGAYCCSKCMEPCAGYVMMKPRDKFCKMCGSRNEVMESEID